MFLRRQKITIIRFRKPQQDHYNVNDELQWFGQSLGLFGLRDKDRSCFRVFIELLKAAKQERAISSDELAYKTSLSRGTVVHHLNKLIQAGIVIPEQKGYTLRVHQLAQLVSELERDLQEFTQELREVAERVDESLDL